MSKVQFVDFVATQDFVSDGVLFVADEVVSLDAGLADALADAGYGVVVRNLKSAVVEPVIDDVDVV